MGKDVKINLLFVLGINTIEFPDVRNAGLRSEGSKSTPGLTWLNLDELLLKLMNTRVHDPRQRERGPGLFQT